MGGRTSFIHLFFQKNMRLVLIISPDFALPDPHHKIYTPTVVKQPLQRLVHQDIVVRPYLQTEGVGTSIVSPVGPDHEMVGQILEVGQLEGEQVLHLLLPDVGLLALALVVDVDGEEVLALVDNVEGEVEAVAVVDDDLVPRLGDEGDVLGVLPVHDGGVGDLGVLEVCELDEGVRLDQQLVELEALLEGVLVQQFGVEGDHGLQSDKAVLWLGVEAGDVEG